MTGDGWIRIGALVTMQELIDSEMVPAVLKVRRPSAWRTATSAPWLPAGEYRRGQVLLQSPARAHGPAVARYETNSPADPLPTGLPITPRTGCRAS
jgi:hypothetical protein